MRELCMKYQRIGITGSHGTGKSTLAKRLSKEFNLPYISEVARRYDLPNLDAELHCEIQKRLLFEQIEEEAKYQSFVSDRTTVDNLAYWLALCAQKFPNSDSELYIQEARNHMSLYDKIYFIPIRFPIQNDGFRFMSKSFQQEISDLIYGILLLWNVDFEVIDPTKCETMK